MSQTVQDFPQCVHDIMPHHPETVSRSMDATMDSDRLASMEAHAFYEQLSHKLDEP